MSLLAVVIVSVVSLSIAFDNSKKITDEKAKLNVKLISRQIDEAFNEQKIRMLGIANTVSILNLNKVNELNNYLSDIRKEYSDMDPAIAFANGEFMNAQKWIAPKGFALNRPWYTGAQKTENLLSVSLMRLKVVLVFILQCRFQKSFRCKTVKQPLL